MSITFFSRDEWGARAPQNRKPFPVLPSARHGLTVHHNGPELKIPIAAMSVLYVQAIQRYHMDSKGWSDIAYSFLFDNFGQVFIARGLVWDQFANGDDLVGEDEGPDTEWYTAMWLGGGDEKPSLAAYEAITEITKLVRQAGAGLKVRPHNQFQHKACPGPELTLWSDTWNLRPFELTPASGGQTGPEEEEEEDMRQFVLADQNNAIYELVQTTPGGATLKRAVSGAEWKIISHFYESKLVTFRTADLDGLETTAP